MRRTLNTSENRRIITTYLDGLSENTFISDVVIPLMGNLGYSLVRINDHGPGEAGKDIIFQKPSVVLNTPEYVSIQAKAQPINTSNINPICQSLLTAYKVPFQGLIPGEMHRPNTVLLMSARRASNDAITQSGHLVEGNQNIRFLFQEHICDLMISTGTVPLSIAQELERTIEGAENEFGREVRRTLLSGNPSQIEDLLENRFFTIADQVDTETIKAVFEYIMHRWDQDPTWDGRVKPIKWIRVNLHFMSKQVEGGIIDRILSEYFSSRYYSYEAENDTREIIRSLSPRQLISKLRQMVTYTFHCLHGSDRTGQKELFAETIDRLLSSQLLDDHPIEKELIDNALQLYRTDYKKDPDKYDLEYKKWHREWFKYVNSDLAQSQ